MQALLSQSQADKTERIEEENSDLKSELAVLRLQLAERDRKIETLERKLEYSKSSGANKAAALPVSPVCIDFQVVICNCL